MQSIGSLTAKLRRVIIACLALAVALAGLAVQPAVAAGGATFHGTGDFVSDRFVLDEGIYTLLLTYSGPSAYRIAARARSEAQGVIGTLIDEHAGGVEGGAKIAIVTGGEGLRFDVDAPADVAWEATFTRAKLPTTAYDYLFLSGTGTNSWTLHLLEPGIYTYSLARGLAGDRFVMGIRLADADGSNIRYLTKVELTNTKVKSASFTLDAPTLTWVELSGGITPGQHWSYQVVESVPKIVGTAAVGKTIKVEPGAWVPAGAQVTYQWSRRKPASSASTKTKIKGATKSTYTLTAADKAMWITVAVTAKTPGAASVTKHSAKVRGVAGTLTSKTPKISGTAKVYKKLTAKPGTWKPSGVTFSYQWLRNGKKIKGATKSAYKLTRADKGKKISVTVKGKKPGYKSVTLTSAKTSKVR